MAKMDENLSSEERAMVVDALKLKMASLERAARAETDVFVAERRQAASAQCANLIAKFR